MTAGCHAGWSPLKPFRFTWERPGLAALAGAFLTVILAGWPALLAGSGAGPGAADPSVVLTALQVKQARVLNPGPPTGLIATGGNGQVSLSWTAPASDGGTQITSYNIYQGTTQAIKGTAAVASSKGTSITVKNLADGTTYYFKVTAVNKAGEGPASAVTSAAPVSAITAPGAPAGLTATPGNGRVILFWTAPASDGGAGISGYRD